MKQKLKNNWEKAIKIWAKIEPELEKIGPTRCFIYGVALSCESYYIRYYKAIEESIKGNYSNAAAYFIGGFPLGITSDLALIAGGYLVYNKIKEKTKYHIRHHLSNFKKWAISNRKTIDNIVESPAFIKKH